eukprot:1979751-Lingulodinium_polyedra.AAC.1
MGVATQWGWAFAGGPRGYSSWGPVANRGRITAPRGHHGWAFQGAARLGRAAVCLLLRHSCRRQCSGRPAARH